MAIRYNPITGLYEEVPHNELPFDADRYYGNNPPPDPPGGLDRGNLPPDQPPPVPPPAPPPPAPPLPNLGDGSGRTFVPPSFDIGDFEAPDPFSYAAFQGPDANTYQADPGYEVRLKRGLQAATNAASSTGLARSGPFVKGITDYAQDSASQEFGNAWNRSYQTWAGNRGAAAEDYDRNYQGKLTDYLVDYERESDEFTRAAQGFGLNVGAQDSRFGQLLSLYDLATRNLPSARDTLGGYGY